MNTTSTIINFFIATLLVFTSSGLVAENGQQNSTEMAHGIDVSHYQGVVRWDQVKQQNITFAFVKATGGNTYIDPEFEHNWHSLRAEGIIRGAYHFFYPNEDATTQAQHFIDTIKGQGGMVAGDLPPVLDVEITDGMSSDQIVKGVSTWLNAVEQALGCQPIIYTAQYFANEYLGNHFSNYPLWIAEYTTRSQPILPEAWTPWSFWQYSENGHISGINGAVDMDKFNGSVTELKSFAQKLCP